eukprot:1159368-Pelagomonas_calceolata.AAC.1
MELQIHEVQTGRNVGVYVGRAGSSYILSCIHFDPGSLTNDFTSGILEPLGVAVDETVLPDMNPKSFWILQDPSDVPTQSDEVALWHRKLSYQPSWGVACAHAVAAAAAHGALTLLCGPQ